MTEIRVTLTLEVETDEGKDLTPTQRTNTFYDIEEAIKTRLFGEGFLPPDIHVKAWGVR